MHKTIFFLFLSLLAHHAPSYGRETNICIENKTHSVKKINVTDIDNYDWEKERPDQNFQNVIINPGQEACKREDINIYSKPQFSFVINNQKTRMKYLEGAWLSVQNINKQDSLYGLRDSRDENRYTLGSYLPGGICRQGSRCSRFEIREHSSPPNSWMSGIDNGMRLDQISIPGTHDSAAYKIDYRTFNPTNPIFAAKALSQYTGPNSLFDIAATDYNEAIQTSPKMDISSQLNSGVRFLDLRGRRKGNGCLLHHGGYYLMQTCGDFLSTIYKFLDENPTETVVLSIKTEYDGFPNAKSMEEIIKNYIYNEDGGNNKKYWYIGASIPSLGRNTKDNNINEAERNLSVEYHDTNVRGRIVLLRRFDSEDKNFGIPTDGWPDDNWGYTDDKKIFIQDEYKNILANNKWNMIQKTFERRQNEPGIWFINFTSAYYALNTPYDFAMNINFRVKNNLKGESGNFGTVVMDFITPEISEIIYSTNFGGWAKND